MEPQLDRLPEHVRDALIEITSLSPGDVAAVGTLHIGPALAAYLLEADDLYQTMQALTRAREINPNIMRLLSQPSTVETLQLIATKTESDQ